MGFSRQEYWSRLPFPSLVIKPTSPEHPGIKPTSPAFTGRFFTDEPWGKPTQRILLKWDVKWKSSRSCFVVLISVVVLQNHLIWSLLIWNLFSCFLFQKEKESLNGELHELKIENNLLKEKNALMNHKKQHYECEIKRLNKVSSQVKLERSNVRFLYKEYILGWNSQQNPLMLQCSSQALGACTKGLCNFINLSYIPRSAILG